MLYREVCKNGRDRILYGSKDLMNGFVVDLIGFRQGQTNRRRRFGVRK